jgi:hypothetical protein
MKKYRERLYFSLSGNSGNSGNSITPVTLVTVKSYRRLSPGYPPPVTAIMCQPCWFEGCGYRGYRVTVKRHFYENLGYPAKITAVTVRGLK